MSIQLTTLENGLRVISDFIPQVETVSLGAWLNVGTRHEAAPVNGIAHMLEHMAFKGTTRRTALQIATEIEAVGGYLNAYTSRETTAYYARILKNDVNLAVDVLGDILQNSTFDAVEFAREQSVVLQEIGQANDTPDDIVFDYFQETCYPGQPMGRPTLGKAEIVQNLTPELVHNYMKRNYGAQQMVFAAAGNIDHNHLVDQVRSHFSSLKPNGLIDMEAATYKGGDCRLDKDLEQVHLVLGFEGLPYQHPDYYTLSVLSTLLGGGMSSRLFQEIREKRGLVYSIYAATSSYWDSGQFTIYAGTGEDEVKDLLPVMCEELCKAPKTLTSVEIDRAKTQLKASLMMGLESTSNRCERLANQLLIYGRTLSPQEIVQSIDAVSMEDLSRIATQIFRSAPTLTTLGPIKHVLPFDELCNQLQY